MTVSLGDNRYVQTRPPVNLYTDAHHGLFRIHGRNATGRALFHGAADVLTLGIWEVVGTPFEAIVDGTEIKVKVNYDEEERVDQVEVIEGMTKLEDVDSIAGTEKIERKSPEKTEPSAFDL